jgi:hypothetical protein
MQGRKGLTEADLSIRADTMAGIRGCVARETPPLNADRVSPETMT